MNDAPAQENWITPRTIIIFLILPLLVGSTFAFIIPRPQIGIIRLNDAIYFESADALIQQIEHAREDAQIRAVLLVLNTPGGTVVDTEAVYLELIRLKARKPVVVYVQGMAASGGYYLSAAANEICSGPSSVIGNVGVIVTLPEDPFIVEDIVTTGPYKMTGTGRDTTLREIDVIKQGFYQAVVLGRGERLKLDIEGLLSGRTWMASEALQYGLIDGLSSFSEALDNTARLAKIRHYETVELRDRIDYLGSYEADFFSETEEGTTTPLPSKAGIYLLYVPPSARRLP
jgi:protease-4